MEYKSITKSAYKQEGLNALRIAKKVTKNKELKEKLIINMNSDCSRKTCWAEIKKRYIRDELNRDLSQIPLIRLIDFKGNQLNRELMYLNYLYREPIACKTVIDLIYPRLLKFDNYVLSRQQVMEYIIKYITYSKATLIKTASQITRALLDFKIVQKEGKNVKVSFKDPSIYSFLYGLYSEYSNGLEPARRFKILNPSLEHIRNKAYFYKLLLIRPSMLRSYLKISWEKGLLVYEPRGGLDQYVLCHKTLDGFTDYILTEGE